MMGLETIRQLSREAATNAEEQGLCPRVIDTWDVAALRQGQTHPLSGIPNLGDFVPEGWEQIEIEGSGLVESKLTQGPEFDGYFVDSSGMGVIHEPALTVSEFIEVVLRNFEIDPDIGYGIVETGQFQIVISVYRRT